MQELKFEDLDVELVSSEETTELGPGGELIRYVVYRYTLQGYGPFEVRLPLTEDTEENIKEAILERAKKLNLFKKKKS